MAHGPHTAYHETLRPLLAQIQWGQPPTSKARWAHLSQIWPPIPPVPQMAKRTPGHKLANLSPWPLEITRGHQIKLRKVSPSFRGKTSPHQCTPYHGFRNGAYMV
ncbi:hypothetical protein O181_037993 [Austropuccinia psidii MF-1]|uniref:Uncharacterized protein n=1 Tax=Austropuccinia psidii MF-1 TaxID=1389203 RepID=A0A9Q3HAM2_9BASI|nr:hypothetical protein [Austropuccinia psidii MF-1]